MDPSAVNLLRHREETFLRRNVSESLRTSWLETGLNPDNLFHYGEFLFVVAGLKPAMLFSHLTDQPMAEAFFAQVALPFLSESQKGSFCLRPVKKLVTSNGDLSNSWLIYDHTGPHAATVAALLRTLEESAMVPEIRMAELLDYPVSLPEEGEDPGASQFYEVGYLHVQGVARTVLTSYGAFEHDLKKVRQHFARYSERLRGMVELELALIKM